MTPEAIEEAAARLAGIANRTPLLESRAVNERIGGRLLVKAESLQHTGSFKFRGAYNKISRHAARADRPPAIVAYSSGNHAQGVAAAARLFGIPATIVMPSDAPETKKRRVLALGAAIRPYDRYGEDRQAIAERLVAESGALLVKPYDDPDIVAGQGTVGLEIAAQAEALGLTLDAVAITCGGGGLSAGVATALSAAQPDADILIAEPEGYDDTLRSLAAGHRVANAGTPPTLCDALQSREPGELTFDILKRRARGGAAVSDREVLHAMAAAFEGYRLVAEPGGAAALAAVLSGKIDVKGKTAVAVISGGNVDPALLQRALGDFPDPLA